MVGRTAREAATSIPGTVAGILGALAIVVVARPSVTTSVVLTVSLATLGGLYDLSGERRQEGGSG